MLYDQPNLGVVPGLWAFLEHPAGLAVHAGLWHLPAIFEWKNKVNIKKWDLMKMIKRMLAEFFLFSICTVFNHWETNVLFKWLLYLVVEGVDRQELGGTVQSRQTDSLTQSRGQRHSSQQQSLAQTTTTTVATTTSAPMLVSRIANESRCFHQFLQKASNNSGKMKKRNSNYYKVF